MTTDLYQRYLKFRAEIKFPEEPCFVGYWKPTRQSKASTIKERMQGKRKTKHDS